jgi:peptidoglycan/LPS O-acetylase OafA/YrhL
LPPRPNGMSTKKALQITQGKYRPEIDGLRAFAVIAVIINHFNKEILPGGYLGVDIFFVISGYVITSSLHGRPSKDFKDFIGGFYERRIKRLIPALSSFVLITSVAICLFNPSPVVSLKTGITSLFGLSNIYLLKQLTDYFAQSTELNAFAHTWSLGVEEQFYILFPFLIWFSGFGRQTKNGARNLFLTVGTLSIASLISFLYLYSANQPASYFLMPSRFWEMATGCLIFIGFQKRASIEQLLEKVPPLLVIALIVAVMYLPIPMATASTIAVVALSSILIASLKKKTAVFRIFTNPKVVYIGLISYSLYLWHWGVLSISRWTIGIHWWSAPIQVALMLGLAVASYRYIETPLRKCNWLGKRWKTIAVGVGFLGSSAGILVAFAKIQTIFLGAPKPPYGEAVLKESSWSTKNCSGSRDSTNIAGKSDFKDCFLISPPRESPKKKVILFVYGDSYAQQIIPELKALSNEDRYKVNIVYSSGCPSLFDVEWSAENPKGVCSNTWKNYLAWVEKIGKTGDILLLANANHYYFTERYTDQSLRLNGKDLTREESHKILEKDLTKTANRLRKDGIRLIVSSGIPYINSSYCDQWYFRYNNKCMYSMDIEKSAQVKATRDVQLIAAARGKFLLLDFYKAVEDFALKRDPRITSFYYSNEGHLNSSGVRKMISQVMRASLKQP